MAYGRARGSSSAEDVRATGLNPAHGGGTDGLSDVRSIASQREKNIAGSRGKVFVTRKWSEAKQYAESHEGRVIRVIVPLEDQTGFEVDPDSAFGLSHNIKLRAMDVHSRQLDWWAFLYVAKLLNDRRQIDARGNLATLYSGLVGKGAFLTPHAEPVRTAPGPIT